MSRKAEIKLTIDLDGDNLPTAIKWEASEARADSPVNCESVMLSLWDGKEKIAPSIDLWTRSMTIEDMNLFFYETLHKMADTYRRATGNAEVAKVIHEFGDEFGANLGITGHGSADATRSADDESVDLASMAAVKTSRSSN